jgi:hypothetical protein
LSSSFSSDSQKATNNELKKKMVIRDGGLLRKIDFDPKDAQNWVLEYVHGKSIYNQESICSKETRNLK